MRRRGAEGKATTLAWAPDLGYVGVPRASTAAQPLTGLAMDRPGTGSAALASDILRLASAWLATETWAVPASG